MPEQLIAPPMEPLISLTIRNGKKAFQPGDELEYEFQVDAVDAGEIQAVEASVMWYTEGKGDEDIGVHDFHRAVAADLKEGDLRELKRFHTILPNSPLSYDGLILKVHWCVRVRVFLGRGKETFFELPFQLGNVPRVDAVNP